MKKRLLSMFTALCLCLTLLPTAALAGEDTEAAPACTCETACTAEEMAADCPVCGGEGASPEDCCAPAEPEDGDPAQPEAPAGGIEDPDAPGGESQPGAPEEPDTPEEEPEEEPEAPAPGEEGESTPAGDAQPGEDVPAGEEPDDEAVPPAPEEAPLAAMENGVSVQAGNELFLGGVNVLANPSGSGYSYDAATNTLTLDNYSVSGTNYHTVKNGSYSYSFGAYLYTNLNDLNLVLKGTSNFKDNDKNLSYLSHSDEPDTVRAVGIYAINLTISEQSTGTLNITTRLFPFYLGSLDSKGGTLNLTSCMEGGIAKNIQINSIVTACSIGDDLDFYGLKATESLVVQEKGDLEVYSSGCYFDYKGVSNEEEKLPSALLVASSAGGYHTGTMKVSGKVYAESGINTGKTDGCQSRGITTGDLTIFNGGKVTAKVNGQKNGAADSREAIHVSGTLGVAENGYIRGETNNSSYSGIHADKLYIRSNKSDQTGFAAITQPVRGEYYNGDFYTSSYLLGEKSQTVEITGLNRCTLYLRRVKATNLNFWYKTYSFSKDHVEDANYDNTSYDATADKAKYYDLANGQYASTGGTDPKDYKHLGHIEIQDTANLLLDNVVRTDLTDTFITVKSGQTLNLKLKINTDTQTGPSLLHGNSTKPLIVVESGATLNLLTDSGNKGYAALSLINEGGPTIGGSGTVNAGECVLYTRGRGTSDIQANLTLQSKSYVDCTYFSGSTLTMNGGALFGKAAEGTTVKGVGSLELSNKPALKNGSGTALYPAEVTVYDTEAQFSKAQLVTNIRTSPTASTPLHRSFLLITELGYGDADVKTGSIPVLFDPDTQKHSTVTVYLPENTRVAKATVGGVNYWSSALKDQQIIAKKDGTGKGVLFVVGTLLLDGTMAFRQFTWASLQDGSSGTVRQLCSDYRYDDDSRNYWIDYDDVKTGITLQTPEGHTRVTGYDVDLMNGEHELMLNGLYLIPAQNPCAKVAGGWTSMDDSTLTLKLINGTSNTLETQNGNPVFVLSGNLVITSEAGKTGTLTIAGSTKAFGSTSAETSSLTIRDSIVNITCADKSAIDLERLTISGSTVTGLGTIHCADIRIDGGSVDLDVPEGTVVKNSAGTALIRQTLTISGISSQTKVDALTISGLPEGNTFDTSNIHTDGSGRISLWLPEGATVETAKIGDTTYYPIPDGNGGTKLSSVEAPSFTVPTEASIHVIQPGGSFTLTASAIGVPAPGLQWQMSGNGTDWTDIPGASGSTYTGQMTRDLHGVQLRCAASNTAGTAYSEPFTLYAIPAVTVTERPSKSTFAPGEQVRFAFTVKDLANVTVRCQWQVNRPGESSWEDISGADTTAYTVPVGEDMDGWRYRCEVTFTYPGGAVETAYASGGRLQVVRTPVIAAQPQSVTVTAGADAAFSVTASGSYYELPCQWQVSADGGQTWTDVPGSSGSAASSQTASLALPAVTAEMNGWQYRCVLTHAFDHVERSVTSNAAVLTVVGMPEITAQPKDLSCRVGRDALFSVTASGNQTLSYQWQFSTDEGQTWTDIPGADSAAYTVAAVTREMGGQQLRCAVTNSADGQSLTVISDTARLTIRSGSSSGTVSASYGVTVRQGAHGTVSASPSLANEGSTVTVAVKPNSGYVLETLTVTDGAGKERTLTDLGGGRYSFAMPAGAVTVAASFMEDNSVLNFFVDVPNDAYYFEPVKWAVGKGITGGTDSLHFSPDRPCTRAQMVTFLWRAAGSPVVNFAMDFADAAPDAYYTEAVRWAASLGIASGYGDGRFGVSDTITREQAATMLYRFAKAQGLDTTQGGMAVREFDDFDRVSPYAGEAIAWAVNAGVLQGTDNRLLPQAPCTRAQIVTFLYRALSGR